MTVSYQYEVASSTSGGFTKLLFMWRGSLYKLIYRELLLFVVIFAVISSIYRHVFNEPQKREFEKIVVYCDSFVNYIPLSFLLGFYVSYVAGRWWQQYTAIPWPDKVMHSVALYVTGDDEYGRMLRRALMRYLNLSLILVLRSISSAVKRRFPTLDHVVDSGFMTSLELELFQSVPSVEFNTYWIPCTWFINLLKETRQSNRLPDSQGLKIIMEEFNDFRGKCGLLWSYDWVSIPLVYTQVVTLATYSFFVVALIGRQYIEGAEKAFQMQVDMYLPIFTILQFLFYMGLLKVAEQLINPFGDDDEDFELNWMIDRHMKVSYLGVDTLMYRCPPLVKDMYFDAEDLTLPYTEAAAGYKKRTYRGSVANMMVPEEKQTMFLPELTEEDEDRAMSRSQRTSSASLVTAHSAADSPLHTRRQIHGSPAASASVDPNRSETTIQIDLNEASAEPEKVGRHYLPKLTGRSRCPTPRPEKKRKPFFGVTKVPMVNLQPWPSATNLAGLATHNADTPSLRSSVTSTEGNPTLYQKSFLNGKQCPHYDGERQLHPSDALSQGIVNSAFLQERLANFRDDSACRRNSSTGSNDNNKHSAVCQFQDPHQNAVQAPGNKSFNVATGVTPRPRVLSSPRFAVRRQRLTGSVRNKKGVHWKPIVDEKTGVQNRRKTVDCVPTVDKIIPQTASSPNLSSFYSEVHSEVFSSVDESSENANSRKREEEADAPEVSRM